MWQREMHVYLANNSALVITSTENINPLDTSNWKSILGPERVQTVEYVHRAKNHEKSAQNRFL